MNLRRAIRASISAVLLFAAIATSAHADAPLNGWGMAIADDDAISSTESPPRSINNSRFFLLRPKTYRFQIYWDAADTPSGIAIERARAQIARARAVGVEEIVATFKKHGETPPTPAQYEAGIRGVVSALAADVDVWGPANEPNAGEAWLKGASGAATLAAFNSRLADVVDDLDSTALRTSPDFLDKTPATSPNYHFTDYIDDYLAAGGGWGHRIAFHPYVGATLKTRSTVQALADASAGSGKSIWITEVGFGTAHGLQFDAAQQQDKVDWMVNGEPGNPSIASHPRVSRIYYYDMLSEGDSATWDTGLLNHDLSPRPAWQTWCAASHGGDANHADCSSSPPEVGGDVAAIGGDGSAWLKAGLIDGPWVLAGGPEFATRDIDLGPDRLAAAAGDGAVWLKDGLPGAPWTLLAGTGFNTRDLELDGNRVVAATGDGAVRLKDGLSGAPWTVLGGPEFDAREISLDGNRLAVTMGNGSVWLKDGLLAVTWHMSGGTEFDPRDIELSGNRLAVTMGNGSVWIKEGLPGGPWLVMGGTEFNARDIALDGNRLAVATSTGAVWIKDGLPGAAWSLMAGPELDIHDLDLDGNRIAAASGDGTVWLKNGLGASWSVLGGAGMGVEQVSLP